jgi:hypothetical protein
MDLIDHREYRAISLIAVIVTDPSLYYKHIAMSPDAEIAHTV